MKKNILILSTSPRKNGNSEMLAREFARGAEEAGHNVELLSLHDKTIGFCKGCLACQKTQRCVIHDDADAIVRKMKDAEVIAFATPIYFYEMCGQMKTARAESLGRHRQQALLQGQPAALPILCSRRTMRSGTFICWQRRRTARRVQWTGPSKAWGAGSPVLKRPR